MDPLYSKTKVFHFPDRLSAQARGEHIAPLSVRIKPTNRCNHRCWYCCFRVPNLPMAEGMHEKDEIPWPRLGAILHDLIDLGIKAVTFSGGGEPLLYDNIVEAVEILCSAGVRVGVLTNGAFLEGEVARVLANKATWVRISIDAGTPKTYALVRRVKPKEFERVCANIEAFSRLGPQCELGVNYVVTKENSGETYDFLRLMKGLGVKHVKVAEAVVGKTFEENVEYVRPWLAQVKHALSRAREELEGDGFRVVDRLLDPSRPNGYEKTYSWCPFASWLTVIGADLRIYTCQDKAYTESGRLADLSQGSFRDIWFAPKTFERLRNVNPAKDCRHHCVSHEKNLLLLDYFAADPLHVVFV